MHREDAVRELKKRVRNKNLLKHMFAVEAVMGSLARHLGQDEDKWALAGLLHDIDYEETDADPSRHSLVSAEIIEAMGVDPETVYAVRVHNAAHGLPRKTLLDHALHIADPLTGLVVAAALIHPDKKLASIDAGFILNRFGEKQFARGANREQIALCEQELGMTLEEFIRLGHQAMLAISDNLGL